MTAMLLRVLFTLQLLVATVTPLNILVTNDDGWAVAQIRTEFNALVAAGHNVILSAPADDESGTGAEQAPPQPRTDPCEFDSCPANSGPTGFNASDPRLNWVNSFPADSVQHGIETLAPMFFNGAPPDFVVSGPNVGSNTGFSVFGSGTIGAAGKAVELGVPAIAFSGTGSAAHESFVDLETMPTSPTVLGAEAFASVTTQLLAALFAQPPTGSLLPAGTMLNVNFPAQSDTCTPDTVQWVLTRALPAVLGSVLQPDVVICDNGGVLPQDSDVVTASGCFATVTVIDALLKLDADKGTQADVLQRLSKLGFACFPS